MGSRRTAWHFFFCILLRRYGPSAFEIRDEVPLSEEPLRIDYLLLRRTGEVIVASAAQTLLALWPMLPQVTIAELKSVGRLYGKGELDRLWSYTHAYHAAEHASLAGRSDLAALLLVPTRTPTLDADAAKMGLVWVDLGAGYWRLTGGLFTLYVVEIDVAADQPDEDLLTLYSHHEVRTPRATRFWGELKGAEAEMDVHNLEGYEEAIKSVRKALPLEQRVDADEIKSIMSSLPLEQRVDADEIKSIMSSLPLEQRVDAEEIQELMSSLPLEQRVDADEIKSIMSSLPLEQRVDAEEIQELMSSLPLEQRVDAGEIQELMSSLPLEQRVDAGEIQELMSSLPLEQRVDAGEIQELMSSLPLEQRVDAGEIQGLMSSLPPEQRLAGLAPEQRLAGLDRDHQALALPLDVLRMLPDDYVRSLSPEIQAELRRRLRDGDA